MAQKLTKEEIARQFQLPERKSKLASLFKKDLLISCLCKSQDCSLFLVLCDLCGRNYHGHCVGLTEKEFKNIERYYCLKCQEEDPSLVSVFRESSKTCGSKIGRLTGRSTEHVADPEYLPSKKGIKKYGNECKSSCGLCKNCRRTANCGVCHPCKTGGRYSNSKRKEKCVNRTCIRFTQTKVEADMSCSDEEGTSGRLAASPARQCYGPGCVHSAQPDSKYCSEKCGMKLATNRILQILPQRLQEWSLSASSAEIVDKGALEDVRKKQSEVQEALQELEKKSTEFEAIIAKGQLLEPCVKVDLDPTKKIGKKVNQLFQNEGEDSSIYCVTCGQEIHTSSAIKHMEKCFIKYESQSSFGSMYQTRVQGKNIFCDFFNPSTKTYCKRLGVICPEHRRERLPRADEACGCPLWSSLFVESSELCLLPKRFCLKHYSWEKIRRAEIDLERVRQWLKMDELFQTEALVRQRMSQRAGVLALLLHSTYDHEALEEMTAAQEEERLAQLEKTLRQNYDKQQFEKITKEHKKFIKSIEKTVKT